MRKMNLGGSNEIPKRDVSLSKRQLLARLVQSLQTSPYLDNRLLVYKGGLFLGEHTGYPRFTQDVDVTLLDADAYTCVKAVLEAFGDQLVSESVISSFEIKAEAVKGRSGGAKFLASTGRVSFSIDVSLEGDVPLATTQIDTAIAGPLCLTTTEQVLCDKLRVLYSRLRFRRAKDLYDVWLILNHGSYNVHVLREMLITCGVYPLPVAECPFRDDYIRDMQHAYEKFRLIDAVTEEEVAKPDFFTVVEVVGGFLVQFMEDDT